ncbi:MAG: glycosyltransferase family 8 protein [Bacteroidales bacterium]|nr:glycosyltransferase family 8 protein [Bacteroidales bacterium]
MDILLCTDNRYVMPTGVLMHSIGVHNQEPIRYHILVGEGFEEQNRVLLEQEADKAGSTCYFYSIDKSVTSHLPFGREGMPRHVSIATYYRLFITEVLPKDIHRILYLDGDMIVRHSLSDLWNMDIECYPLGAVHDMAEPLNAARLGLSSYFNAGMLLINLDYWRDNHCLESFLAYIGENEEKILLHDQDVLNGVFASLVKWLPLTYNFQNGFILAQPHKQYNPLLQSEIDDCKNDPAIIHYTVYNKPWNVACFHPFRDEWRRYQMQTPWKEYRYDEPMPKKWIHYLRNWLFRYTSYVPKYDRTEYEQGLRKY